MCGYMKGLIDVFSSIWLIFDMVLDGITTAEYYRDATNSFKEEMNPLKWKFLYPRGSEDINTEAAFFYASLGSILLPIPIGILIISVFFTWRTLDCLNQKHLSLAIIFGVFSIVPGLLAMIVSILVMPFVWLVSPFLHFSQAMFALFGVRPVGGRETKIKGPRFTNFWVLVLFLKMIEQFFEALPQVAINGFYLYSHRDGHSEQELLLKTISLIFSAGSVLLFLAMNIFKCTFDYENSMLGLLNRTDSDRPPPYREREEGGGWGEEGRTNILRSPMVPLLPPPQFSEIQEEAPDTELRMMADTPLYITESVIEEEKNTMDSGKCQNPNDQVEKKEEMMTNTSMYNTESEVEEEKIPMDSGECQHQKDEVEKKRERSKPVHIQDTHSQL